MQQRGVIVTAVILALILAGALWYTLTRDTSNGAELIATPTPSPFIAIENTVPVPEELPPIGETAREATEESGTAVSPTAASGTRENMVALLTITTGAGLWSLTRTLRRAASR